MPERCIEWVGSKCVKWSESEDGKLQAEINFGACTPKEKKAIEGTLGRTKGFRFKIRD